MLTEGLRRRAGPSVRRQREVIDRAVSVCRVSDAAAFAGLRDEWTELLLDSYDPSVFLSFEWLWPWWRAFGEGRLAIHTVRHGQRLIGVFPLMETARQIRGVPVTTLRSMTNPHSPRFDVLVRRGWLDQALDAWVRQLVEAERWHVLELAYVPAGSETCSALERIVSDRGLAARRARVAESPCVTLESSWREYYDGRSKSLRKNLAYAERKLAQAGPVLLVEGGRGSGLGPMLGRAFRIESSGWKGELGTAIAASETLTQFYTAVAMLAAERGWFRLYFLTVGERDVAFDYCLAFGDTLSLVKIGYEAGDLEKYSPGLVLRRKVLEWTLGGGAFRKYDMLGTSSAWKMEWATGLTPLDRVFVYGRGVRARVARFLEFDGPRIVRRLPLPGRAPGRRRTASGRRHAGAAGGLEAGSTGGQRP